MIFSHLIRRLLREAATTEDVEIASKQDLLLVCPI